LEGFTKALSLGFFLVEVSPAPRAQPAAGAGLHATFWQPVALAGSAEFEHQALNPLTSKTAKPKPIPMARAMPAHFSHSGSLWAIG